MGLKRAVRRVKDNIKNRKKKRVKVTGHHGGSYHRL